MKVLWAEGTRELDLTGTRAELSALARAIRGGRADVALVTEGDPSPYGSALSSIVVRPGEGMLRIACSLDGAALEVVGGTVARGILADNVEGFARGADPEDHLHVDHFPDHPYLAEGSDSLVVALGAGAG